MAEAMASSLKENVLQCPICTETFTRPRSLPCLHSFCQTCLQTYINGISNRGHLGDGFECPVCRGPTPAPRTDTPSDKWAEYFPTNHVINSLIDELSIKEGEKQCDMCTRRGKQQVASAWCRTCGDCLCQDCNDYHAYLAGNHVVIDIDKMETQSRNLPEVVEICPIHKEKQIEYFCVDYKALCCASCVAVEHPKMSASTSRSPTFTVVANFPIDAIGSLEP